MFVLADEISVICNFPTDEPPRLDVFLTKEDADKAAQQLQEISDCLIEVVPIVIERNCGGKPQLPPPTHTIPTSNKNGERVLILRATGLGLPTY